MASISTVWKAWAMCRKSLAPSGWSHSSVKEKRATPIAAAGTRSLRPLTSRSTGAPGWLPVSSAQSLSISALARASAGVK